MFSLSTVQGLLLEVLTCQCREAVTPGLDSLETPFDCLILRLMSDCTLRGPVAEASRQRVPGAPFCVSG